MATVQVAGAFSLRTGFGPFQIKGPSGKGWSRAVGYIGGTGSVLTARQEQRTDKTGQQSENLPPNSKTELRHLSFGDKEIEKATCWNLLLRPSFYFHFMKGLFFCNKSELHISLNEFCTGFDSFLGLFA